MKIVAVAVFLIVILLIITERVHRTAAAMAGAMVLILTGVMSADKALSYIDFNTIGDDFRGYRASIRYVRIYCGASSQSGTRGSVENHGCFYPDYRSAFGNFG